MKRLVVWATARLIVGFVSALTGVRAFWTYGAAQATPTLYFANHCSHGDFVLVWATLPRDIRLRTRPVAAADYWNQSGLRRFVGQQVFNALLIERERRPGGPDAVEMMGEALRAGDSLIVFPEGTRNTGDQALLPFKSGIYHVAVGCPDVLLIPVWIENLRRVLPKGTIVPVPLACTVRYGQPLLLVPGEDKNAFLARARQAMLELRPAYDQEVGA